MCVCAVCVCVRYLIALSRAFTNTSLYMPCLSMELCMIQYAVVKNPESTQSRSSSGLNMWAVFDLRLLYRCLACEMSILLFQWRDFVIDIAVRMFLSQHAILIHATPI